MKKLYGEDVTVYRTLEKVELAIRRAYSDPGIDIMPPSEVLQVNANHVGHILRDMTK